MAYTVHADPSNREGSQNSLYIGQYRKTYRVRFDSWKAGPLAALAATGIPAIGNTYNNDLSALDPYYEEDLRSWVQMRSAKLTHSSSNPSHAEYLVTVEYGPYDTAAFGNDPANDWPIKIVVSTASFERVVWVDATTGDAICNSAGDPFADPCIEPDDRPLIVVTRAERVDTYDFDLANAYRNSMNDDVWNGYAAKVARCRSIVTGDILYNQPNDYYYYMVQYTFELNRDLWTYKPIDMGMRKLSSGTPVPILDDLTGQPASEPRYLDGSGAVLAPAATPVVLEFDTIPALDFSVFNIDFAAALGR